MNMFKRKPRLLTKLKIDEVSAVDHAAAPGARIVMLKRDRNLKAKFDQATARLAASVKSIVNDPDCDKSEMLGRSFAQFLDHLNKLNKSRTPLKDVVALKQIFAEARAKNLDVSVAEAGDDEGMPNRRRRRPEDDDEREDEAARVAAEMDTDGADRDDDDEQQRNKQMKTHSELMSAVVKKYGIVAFCKSVEKGDVAVSEHQLTSLISEHCARTGVSFSKLFEAQDEQGITLRKAIAAARDAQFLSRTATVSKLGSSTPHFHAAPDDGPAGTPGRATLAPRFVAGADARAVDNPRSALDQLNELAAEQRRQNKTLSEAGAFARVYEDKANAELVRREREENRPTSVAW
jgi:hypothetical protein